VDKGVIILAIRSSQLTVNTCGNSCYNLLNLLMHTNVGLPKTGITSGFYSLVAVKVTFVVSSGKNIFITV